MSKKGNGYDPEEALRNAFETCDCPAPLFCEYAALVTNATTMNLELARQAIEALLAGQQAFLEKIPPQMFAFADWVAVKGSRESVLREVRKKSNGHSAGATAQR